MSSLIYSILLKTSILSPYVTLFFIIKNRRTLNSQLGVLFFYLLISISVELRDMFKEENSNTVALLFTVIEYSSIACIFWLEFKKKAFRIIIYVFSILFFILTVLGMTYFNAFKDDISTTSEGIIIITLGILYFLKIFNDLDIPKLTNYYFFWLNSAFLLYFSTALFLFSFKSYIKTIDDQSVSNFLWGIHLIINIAYNILLTIGICKHRKT